jgi:hypothetical protein
MNITITNEGPSFFEQVRKMRNARKEFYRTRDRALLAHAKQLEREADIQLDAWQQERIRAEAQKTRPELFPAE